MIPTRFASAALCAAGLAGCIVITEPGGGSDAPASLPVFGDGYPNAGDPCLRVGENAVTSPYLDDAADLVACPPSTDAGLFAFTYNAVEVARVEDWVLFSIPRR